MKIPAFIDSHLHFIGIGYYQEIINLKNAKSIKDIKEALIDNQAPVIFARGFNQENLIEKRMPNKSDFSDIEKPVVLVRVCGHVAVVNQAMLDYLKIDEFTKSVPGGNIDYNSGIFSEKALSLIFEALPKPTLEDLKRYIITANKILLENGITKVASDDFSTFDLPYEMVIKAFNEADQEGLLQVEVVEQVNLPYDRLQDFIKKGYANKKYHNFKMGPLKILGDGSLGGKTAALISPYENDLNNYGILTYSDEELFDLVALASQNDMDSVIHAIGDRAALQAINIISKAQRLFLRKSPHNAIIHAQILNKKLIQKMAENHIGAIVQPIFLNSDIPIIEERIGERYLESYLFKTMYNSINVGFSTDAPVDSVNPFYNLYSAISRKSIKFNDLPAFLSEEAFTIKEALLAYNENNFPYLYINENLDYIEIDKDIYNCEIEDIKQIKVLKTYKAANLVFERKN
ncbi:MAG: amidohydrolase family protein [Candidatus Izemoplasmatales bacterium]|jgi:predicted amidohydrolase YtcJ|nr:amidohydrolase family protein [Candidatus Izemoplasmatales bacterium]